MGSLKADPTDPLFEPLRKVVVNGEKVCRSTDAYEISPIDSDTGIKSIKIRANSSKMMNWTEPHFRL